MSEIRLKLAEKLNLPRAERAKRFVEESYGRLFSKAEIHALLMRFAEAEDAHRLAAFDYESAMEELSRLMEIDPLPTSPEGRRLMELADKIQEYERRHKSTD